MEKLTFIVIIILVLGCEQRTDKASADYQNEIDSLETIESKRKYLEQILEDDQKVRDEKVEAELISTYGYDSKEHMNFNQEQWRQDEINLVKTEAYLAKFGYPKKTELGKDAAMAPWAVIHHSTDIEARNRNFIYLYNAYLKGDINDNALAIYLGRTYVLMNKESFEMKNPYTTEDRINQLIIELGLEEKIKNE